MTDPKKGITGEIEGGEFGVPGRLKWIAAEQARQITAVKAALDDFMSMRRHKVVSELLADMLEALEKTPNQTVASATNVVQGPIGGLTGGYEFHLTIYPPGAGPHPHDAGLCSKMRESGT